MSHMKKGGFVGSMAFCRFQKTLSAAAHAADRSDHYDYHDGGMFRSAWESVLNKVRKQGSVVGEVSQAIVGDAKLKRKDTRGFERSHSTVTATSDVSRPGELLPRVWRARLRRVLLSTVPRDVLSSLRLPP